MVNFENNYKTYQIDCIVKVFNGETAIETTIPLYAVADTSPNKDIVSQLKANIANYWRLVLGVKEDEWENYVTANYENPIEVNNVIYQGETEP